MSQAPSVALVHVCSHATAESIDPRNLSWPGTSLHDAVVQSKRWMGARESRKMTHEKKEKRGVSGRGGSNTHDNIKEGDVASM